MKTENLKRFNEAYPSTDHCDSSTDGGLSRPRLFTYPLCGNGPRVGRGRRAVKEKSAGYQVKLPNLEEDVVQEDLLASKDDGRGPCSLGSGWCDRFSPVASPVSSPRVGKRRSRSYPSCKEDADNNNNRIGGVTTPRQRKASATITDHLPLIRELSENDTENITTLERFVENELTILRKRKQIDFSSRGGVSHRITEKQPLPSRNKTHNERLRMSWRSYGMEGVPSLHQRHFGDDHASGLHDL